MSASLGELLAAARTARGKSAQEAANATRIRLKHLQALEGDRWGELPPPVYVRGYLRTYAAYLDLDPAELLTHYGDTLGKPGKPLALRPLSPLVAAPNMVLTAPVAGLAVAFVMLAGLVAYFYREADSLRTPAPAARVAPTLPPSSPAGAAAVALPSPSPTPRTLHLTVTAADTVWIDAKVDGKPQFGDSGKILQAGDSVSFAGQKISLRTGKGNATLLNLDGKDLGPLGGGVVSKDFSA